MTSRVAEGTYLHPSALPEPALRDLVPQGCGLLFPALDPLTQPGDARLKVGLVDQTLGITVDQPAHSAAQFGDLGLNAGQITCCGVASLIQTSLVFRRDPARILQHTLDLAPDRLVQPIRAHLRVRAQALAAEAVGITAAAAIIGVGPPLALSRTQANGLAVIPHFPVRPDGAYHQWRRVPPGELSIAPVADDGLVGQLTGLEPRDKGRLGRLSNPAGRNAREA